MANKEEYIQQVMYEDMSPPTFQEFSNFWAIGIVPIILAWFAYRSLKLKVCARNKQRRDEYLYKLRNGHHEDIDWADIGDDTMTQYVTRKFNHLK